jgi:dUTP pyrophosphatase
MKYEYIMKLRGFDICKGYEDKDVKLPKRATAHSAGYDFFAVEDVTIQPNEIKVVFTGVKAYMQPNEVLILANRSGNPIKKNLELANGVGIVDADYYENPENDGNIGFQFKNTSTEPVTIRKGEKLGQGIFTYYLLADDDNATDQRQGGFGSTGG